MVNITNSPAVGSSPASSRLPDTLLGFQGNTTQYTYASPSGTSNDVNGGFPKFLGNTRLAVTLAAGNATWTGLEAGVDGQHLILWNTDTANSLTLLVNSAASVFFNRFQGPSANYVLTAGNACELVYYAEDVNAWVIAAGAGSGGGGSAAGYLAVTITADPSNNYNPGGGFPTGIGWIDINPTTNDVTLTGLTAGTDGQVVTIRNIGTVYNVIISTGMTGTGDVLSLAPNRFTGLGDFPIQSNGKLQMTYRALPTPSWAI